MVDHVGASLIRLVYAVLCGQSFVSCRELSPARYVALTNATDSSNNYLSGLAHKIFRAHLFPGPDDKFEESHPVLSSESRSMLNQIVLSLVEADPVQHKNLLLELYELCPPPEYDGELVDNLAQHTQEALIFINRSPATRPAVLVRTSNTVRKNKGRASAMRLCGPEESLQHLLFQLVDHTAVHERRLQKVHARREIEGS